MDEEVTYSFSRLDWTCLFAWHRHYNLKEEGEDNGWGLGGSLLHEICESVAKKESTEEEAYQVYKDNWFDAVGDTFPRFHIDLSTHYYDKIDAFFRRKKWWNGEVHAVEEHIVGSLPNGKKFQGHIDLQLNDGELMVDYKIAKRERFVKELKKKQRQLYLYSYLVHQKHGFYPKKLIFYFFQEPNNPIIIDFNKDDMQEALDWAEHRISIVEKLQLASKKLNAIGFFMPNEESLTEIKKGVKVRNMFCQNVCSYRNNCMFTSGDKFVNMDVLDKVE